MVMAATVDATVDGTTTDTIMDLTEIHTGMATMVLTTTEVDSDTDLSKTIIAMTHIPMVADTEADTMATITMVIMEIGITTIMVTEDMVVMDCMVDMVGKATIMAMAITEDHITTTMDTEMLATTMTGTSITTVGEIDLDTTTLVWEVDITEVDMDLT